MLDSLLLALTSGIRNERSGRHERVESVIYESRCDADAKGGKVEASLGSDGTLEPKARTENKRLSKQGKVKHRAA